jgi:hypothetical protein
MMQAVGGKRITKRLMKTDARMKSKIIQIRDKLPAVDKRLERQT